MTTPEQLAIARSAAIDAYARAKHPLNTGDAAKPVADITQLILTAAKDIAAGMVRETTKQWRERADNDDNDSFGRERSRVMRNCADEIERAITEPDKAFGGPAAMRREEA